MSQPQPTTPARPKRQTQLPLTPSSIRCSPDLATGHSHLLNLRGGNKSSVSWSSTIKPLTISHHCEEQPCKRKDSPESPNPATLCNRILGGLAGSPSPRRKFVRVIKDERTQLSRTELFRRVHRIANVRVGDQENEQMITREIRAVRRKARLARTARASVLRRACRDVCADRLGWEVLDLAGAPENLLSCMAEQPRN